MLFSLNRYNKLFIFLLSINIGIIISEGEKCTSIDHCLKCPENNKCETCDKGYTLNFDQTKCLEFIQPDNSKSTKSGSSKNAASASSASSAKKSSASVSSASSAKKSSASASSASSAKKSSASASSASSAKKSSSSAQKSSASSSKASSSAKKSSSSASKSENKPSGSEQKSGSSSVKKASNAPTASNKPFASAFDSNKDTETSKLSLVVKIIICIVVGSIIFCCLKSCIAKRKKSKVGYFYDESGNPDEKAKVVYIQ